MKKTNISVFSVIIFSILFFSGCSVSKKPLAVVSKQSIDAGTIVKRGDKSFQLLGKPVAVGDRLPDTVLVEASTMSEVVLSRYAGEILFISLVPSIDTKVCEIQTHYLGEEGDALPAGIKRITISRDTPFAQKRFAGEAGLQDLLFLSDHRDGDFGRNTGLLVDNVKLLSRGIIVADRNGVIRYMQIVPVLTELPDMEKAFQEAVKLLNSAG